MSADKWYLLLILVALLSVPLSADEIPNLASLNGRVVDPAHAVIPGVKVIASGARGQQTTVTDSFGQFSFTLEPGEYTLTFSVSGFADASVVVRSKPATFEPVEVILQLAQQTASVTITDMAGYDTFAVSTATKTLTPLRDVPQAISVITHDQIQTQGMQSVADVVRYVPGVTAIQGENNRDQLVIRGNSSSADFFVDGVRDDVQYYRDLYNLDRVEALKGPNAMIFGRGGGGGVINRVTKQAGFASVGELDLQAGSFGNKRATADFDRAVNNRVALRVNGMYENSGSFRDHVDLQRFGINPTLTIVSQKKTQLRFGYEHFRDNRVADRGVPSFRGRPSDADISTFFGNPDQSRVRARVNLVSAVLDHQFGNFNLHNRTLFGAYNRFYQNFVPGVVNADETRVSISAYNNATRRDNRFNQTDLTYSGKTGSIRHTLLAGAEFGRQHTNNFRNTGFFNNTSTTISVPFSSPTIDTPVTFRQNATDADNRLRANIDAAYGQDQIELSRNVQLLAGIRFDHFKLRFHSNRNGANFERADNLWSPRLGMVIKPVQPFSFYMSYSVSYLPSSGDQFSSLTEVTQTLKPEKFQNYEAGAKWDLKPTLSFNAAIYNLTRTNTRATDPNDPTRVVQTGSQRSRGVEVGINGQVTRDWQILGGYAYQDAVITSATIAAAKGARIAQVPRHTFSFWNNYQFAKRWSAGVGLSNRSDMFAAVDNRVKLPAYTRADAALSFKITERVGVQLNVENLTGSKYFLNADSNDNISPGSPRAARLSLHWKFN